MTKEKKEGELVLKIILSCKTMPSQTILILCVSSGFNIQAEADRQLRSKHPPLLLGGQECLNTGEIPRFSLSLL